MINIKTSYYKNKIILLLFAIQICIGCSQSEPSVWTKIGHLPAIFPQYSNVVIPPNIAPLNFYIDENYSRYFVKFFSSKKNQFQLSSSDGNVTIPESQWKKFTDKCRGEKYTVEIFGLKNNNWTKFQTITNEVANDSIDPYLVYRLIEPGFESWGNMGIFQRCLENFRQTPILKNNMSNRNCMNCHSFCNNDSHTMLFHMRGAHAGTVFFNDEKLTKINTKTEQTISPGVYPAWHPGGRFVAFSVNNTVQSFHALPTKKVEVLDTKSDLILFDTKSKTVTNSPEIADINQFETFPTWSPDGKALYFCSAQALPPEDFKNIRYDLCRVQFNASTQQLGKKDTLVFTSEKGKSVSFPRISPDGKYLLFCQSDYGNFSIWHKESDLFLLELESGKISHPEINSEYSESYHTWSSNGRWVIFSSRRLDGLYTRPYITFFDKNGNFKTPFLLPQKKPQFYQTSLKSFNIPELIKSKVTLNPIDFEKVINTEGEKSKFEPYGANEQ